jgi:tetratricopeptide (TPR) repeat protein
MAEQISVAEVVQRLQAGEQLAKILAVPEAKIQGLAVLGYNQYQQGKLNDAAILFRSVTALDKGSYLGYAGLGAVAMASNPPDLDTAYANLSKAEELKPDDATIQANLGEVLLRQGKIDEAKAHLEKAFQLDPERKDRGANRARALVSALDLVVKQAEKLQQTQKVMAKAS